MILEMLRKEIPAYSIDEVTILLENSNRRRIAGKQIIINGKPTNLFYDLERQLKMVTIFGAEYNEILCERIKKQIEEFIQLHKI